MNNRSRAFPRSLLFAAFAGAMFLPFTGCFDNNTVAGGTETETTISGVVRDSGGIAVRGAYAALLKADFNPVEDLEAPQTRRTGTEGDFEFINVKQGVYNLQISHPASGTAALLRGVEAVAAGSGPLTATLAQQAEADIYFERLDAGEGDYIYIPGTDLYARIDSAAAASGVVKLVGVPPSVYPAVMLAAGGSDSGSNLLEADLEILPAAAAAVGPYSSWPYSASIIINTASSGAGVSEDVAGFPLLVRLRAPAFDFALALDDGADLRFSKADGAPLPYEIEQWDAAGGKADVWVRMDTVYGNDDGQFILMHWGMANAVYRGRSEQVFGTDRNFASAWHLGANLQDATSNDNDGMNFRSAPVPGVAGDAREFLAGGQYISFGNGPSLRGITESITVSCWVKTAMTIDSNSNNVSIIRHDGHFTALQVSYGVPDAWTVAWTPEMYIHPFVWDGVFNDNSWHHYVSAYDMNGGLKIYRNGRLYHTDGAVAGPLSAEGVDDFILGGSEDGWEYFNGLLDEVRVSSVVRPEAWIRLCYESQKPGAEMVRIVMEGSPSP